MKYPLQDAQAVANEMILLLSGSTAQSCVAGSVRRCKPMVGDVEILYVDTMVKEPSLFDSAAFMGSATDSALQRLLDQKIIAKRKNTKGHESWGKFNKMAVHVASGIPVDLFRTKLEWYPNSLVLRTGCGELNKLVASLAFKNGWTWRVAAHGFQNCMGAWSIVTSEADVFKFVGLPYLEPHERTPQRAYELRKERGFL